MLVSASFKRYGVHQSTFKRETGGWTMPLVVAGYLFSLAYVASFITYRVALAMGGG